MVSSWSTTDITTPTIALARLPTSACVWWGGISNCPKLIRDGNFIYFFPSVLQECSVDKWLVEEVTQHHHWQQKTSQHLSRGTWCTVTWDGLWVPCQGPKATGHLGRCISDWQVAGNGAWWQSASPGEDASGGTGRATFRVRERHALKGKRWFVLLGAVLRWCWRVNIQNLCDLGVWRGSP